jgi:hypothetical protein
MNQCCRRRPGDPELIETVLLLPASAVFQAGESLKINKWGVPSSCMFQKKWFFPERGYED